MLTVHLSSEKEVVFSWHDINAVYIIAAVFALGVFLFSLAGIRVALEVPEYSAQAWVPWLLLVMSGIVLASSIIRLFKRMYFLFLERREEGGDFLF